MNRKRAAEHDANLYASDPVAHSRRRDKKMSHDQMFTGMTAKEINVGACRNSNAKLRLSGDYPNAVSSPPKTLQSTK